MLGINIRLLTVDRRDGRDQVGMKKLSFLSQFGELKVPAEVEIEYVLSKRTQQVVRSTRCIATKTMRQMVADVTKDIGFPVSYGMVLALKPFYIQNATEREKISCLCKFCLNIRLQFNELQKHFADKTKKTDSITQYYSSKIVCDHDANGFFSLQCISSTSGNKNCEIAPLFNENDFDKPVCVMYDQFVVETYAYVSKKKSAETEGKRTVRKQFNKDFDTFKSEFDSMAQLYLVHRYEIVNDNFLWPQLQILAESNLGYIFHQDYSENISSTPKFEPQDAHFSGKQTSLHSSVVYPPSDKKNMHIISVMIELMIVLSQNLSPQIYWITSLML